MDTKLRGVCAGILLLAARGWAASPSPTEGGAPVKETLGRLPDQAKPLEDQVRQLETSVRELEQTVDQLRERDAERANPPGGPNDHPLWP